MTRSRTAARIALLASLALLAPAAAKAGDGVSAPDPGKVARGKYLVEAIGCGDCHTPAKMGENGPEPDQSRMFSGHPSQLEVSPAPSLGDGPWVGSMTGTFTAWSGPWGISYTRNLTPDDETGIGTWSEQEFVDTIRNGKRRGIGRDLLPPMPWPAFRNFSDEDLGAIYAYLRTVPAFSNRVPDPTPPASAGKE